MELGHNPEVNQLVCQQNQPANHSHANYGVSPAWSWGSTWLREGLTHIKNITNQHQVELESTEPWWKIKNKSFLMCISFHKICVDYVQDSEYDKKSSRHSHHINYSTTTVPSGIVISTSECGLEVILHRFKSHPSQCLFVVVFSPEWLQLPTSGGYINPQRHRPTCDPPWKTHELKNKWGKIRFLLCS